MKTVAYKQLRSSKSH